MEKKKMPSLQNVLFLQVKWEWLKVLLFKFESCCQFWCDPSLYLLKASLCELLHELEI